MVCFCLYYFYHKWRAISLSRSLFFYSTKFLASIRGNINEIVDYLLKKHHFAAYTKQLNEMLKYAPFTSPGAIDCIKDCLESGEEIEEEKYLNDM